MTRLYVHKNLSEIEGKMTRLYVHKNLSEIEGRMTGFYVQTLCAQKPLRNWREDD